MLAHLQVHLSNVDHRRASGRASLPDSNVVARRWQARSPLLCLHVNHVKQAWVLFDDADVFLESSTRRSSVEALQASTDDHHLLYASNHPRHQTAAMPASRRSTHMQIRDAPKSTSRCIAQTALASPRHAGRRPGGLHAWRRAGGRHWRGVPGPAGGQAHVRATERGMLSATSTLDMCGATRSRPVVQ
jgi:hypothetical protein